MKVVSEDLKGLLQVTVMPCLVTMNQFQGLNEDVPPRYTDAFPRQRAWFDYGEGMGVGPSIASVVRYSKNWLLSIRLLLTFSHIKWILLYVS
ncbi:hypothetical protein MKX03_019695, partial [Papaver bracteatum]